MIKISKVSKGLAAMIAMAVLIGLTPVAMLGGCGKKGPPKPPTGSMPPEVRDLGYGVSNSTIKLSWTIPQPDEEAQLPITGFLIFRSQQSLGERECPNCPILFKSIGDVPVRGFGSRSTRRAGDNVYRNHRTRLSVYLQGPRIQC